MTTEAAAPPRRSPRGGRRWGPRLRAPLLLWHRWFGLLGAVWLTLLALTGSVLVFYDELDVLLNPDQRVVAPAASRVPLARVAAAAEAGHPHAYAAFLDLPGRADEAVRVFLAPRPGRPAAHDDEVHVFVDPYTGRVTGERRVGSVGLDRHRLMDFVYGLHVDLHLGGTAVWLLGLLAVLWALDHGAGAVLSFPNPRRWARSFRVPRGARGHARVFSLHRAGGLWLLPVTFVLAVSGAYFNWYDYFEHAAERVSTVTPRYSRTLPEVAAPRYPMAVSLDSAVAAASRAAGGAGVDMIAVMPSRGVYEARVYDARDIDPYGRRLVTVDGRTGRVVHDRHATEGSAADVAFAWQYPLHSGKALGWPGRLLVFAAGLAVAGLSVTGTLHWWRKRRGRAADRG